MRKSATTPRGEEVVSQRILEHHSRKGTQSGNESISSGMSKCLSCDCEKPAFSSYCLKEAIEKDEDLQP